jgi:hypothetical protein
MKKCSICNILKDEKFFSKDNQKKNGLRSNCKECKSIKDKEWREKNKEKKKNIDKEYYKSNSEKIKENSKIWYNNNKDRVAYIKTLWYKNNSEKISIYKNNQKEYMREYFKNKYQNDIRYKLRNTLNKRIRDCIRKNKNTVEYIGCDIEFLIKWLEFQFDKKMNWENYGTYWSLDHVKPCSSFDFENKEEIENCYNWKNLRPCTIQENSSKRNKIDLKLIDEQKNKVYMFKKFIDVPKEN